MQQAKDFLEESKVLHALVAELGEADFEKKTLFKEWTINDILVHLHYWNMNADMALNQPDKFEAAISNFMQAVQTGTLRDYENRIVSKRGCGLVEEWHALTAKIADDYEKADPKQRIKWAGPEMSARTCISARQMEVWAHGQAIFDLLGKDRQEQDRISNIVFLGVNAFGWSHHVHGLAVPDKMPKLILRSPSGNTWEFGEDENSVIEGSAVEFAQVVAQTRNIADTNLKVRGEAANVWMANAQCFAGPAETPPAPGFRKKS